MDQATVVHALLSQCLETSLRQQLLSGEFNAAMMGKVLERLRHINVSYAEDVDASLRHVAKAFRRMEEGTPGQLLEDILNEISPTQI